MCDDLSAAVEKGLWTFAHDFFLFLALLGLVLGLVTFFVAEIGETIRIKKANEELKRLLASNELNKNL